MRKDLAIMGAATDLGQGKAGTELAPSWLRLKGSNEILIYISITIGINSITTTLLFLISTNRF